MARKMRTDIKGVYNNSSDSDQELILNLALFLSNFLSVHLKLLENDQNRDVLLNAHLYLVKISQVDEREVFKITLEYWSSLVSSLYEEQQALPLADNPLLSLNISGGAAAHPLGGMGGPFAGAATLRKHIYAEVLSNLRLVMIERMVKPEEVLVVENDEGEIVREFSAFAAPDSRRH
jgi:exportin-1